MAGRAPVDVVVVGGGPAGLATAIAAREYGLSVIVADGGEPPADKACGEGVMPGGVDALIRLGVEPDSCEAVPFAGIRFIEDGLAAEARFPGRYGLGIRRTTLNRLLAARAIEAGVELRWGARVDAVTAGGVRMGHEVVATRWVVGADGHNSRVRESAGLRPLGGKHRVGFRQHYRVRQWTDLVEVYWHRRGQAYVTPVGADEVCVALIGVEDGLRMTELPGVFPELARRLRDGREDFEPTSTPRGGISASVRMRSVGRGRIALVGDASGSVDAITGEGLSIGFHQALALGRALATGDLRSYQADHRRVVRLPMIMSHTLTLVGRHERLRRRVLTALKSRPSAFSQLLAVHGGAIAPAAIGLETIFAFGWQMLSARVTDAPSR